MAPERYNRFKDISVSEKVLNTMRPLHEASQSELYMR